MTIAQIVYENERAFVADEREVRAKTLRLWSVMNEVPRL
jgi:L-serine deaminase